MDSQMPQIPMNQVPIPMSLQMQQIPAGTVLTVAYPYQQYYMAGPSSSFDRHSASLCPPEKTLWMGSIDTEKWNAEFITEAFDKFGYKVQNVKMVTEKGSDRPASYCFVEFTSEEEAREAMLHANGRTIRNDPERRRFNLSFANSPETSCEYNLFVNNLSSSVDDISLFKIFGEKYKSCRGAKVYRNYDGTSKKSGFVRFTSETDQQLALVEMDKVKLKGKEMFLKLASPRNYDRNSRKRTSYSSGKRDYSDSSRSTSNRPWNASSRNYRRSPHAKRIPPSKKTQLESVDPPSADEHNAHLFETDWELQLMLDSARFSKCLIEPDLRTKDLAVKLYGEV